MTFEQQAQTVINRQGSIAENNLIYLPVTSYTQHQTASPGAFPVSTFHVGLDNRLEAFHKPFDHVVVAQANFYGHHHREPPIHECVAWRLAHAIGPPLDELVAPVVMRECGPGNWGSLTARQAGVGRTLEPIQGRRDQCLSAAFFDALIGQQDRHLGNFRWDANSSHLGLFDHGFAFALPGDLFNASFFVEWRWDSNLESLEQWEIEALEVLLRSHDVHGLTEMLQAPRVDRLQERARTMLEDGVIFPFQRF